MRLTPLILSFAIAFSCNSACVRRLPQAISAAPAADSSDDERALAEKLRDHVEALAGEIGSRSYRNQQQLDAAGEYVLGAFRSFVGEQRAPSDVRALPAPISGTAYTEMRWRNLQRCSAEDREARLFKRAERFRAIHSQEFWNIELSIPGTRQPDEIIVIGAHYDSDACESGGANPGADDNASGVAVLLELATRFAQTPLPRTVRFVAFTNEEEPFFQTDGMGSRIYARNAKARGDDIKAMLSLETIGYYSDLPGSQAAPQPFKALLGLPDVGDFITFVSSWHSRALTQRAVSTFHAVSSMPCEGFSASPWLVEEVHWSDNWSFDEEGVPALMVTDTAPGRNHCYHRACDTPERLDYVRMARTVEGLARVIEVLARSDTVAD